MAEDKGGKDSFDMQFMFRTMAERDPSKRRVKPAPQAFLDTGPMDDSSSDDSDYAIPPGDLSEDSEPISDSESESTVQSKEEEAEDDGEEEDAAAEQTVEALLKKAASTCVEGEDSKGSAPPLICCVCLGDVSLPNDELIECDGCGVTVHEGCYGISDAGSVGSSVSSCSTEPWFCDSCKAGNFQPRCELCPNEGGVFKETDVGQWVHLVCALFVPGVAFHDVDALSAITLFELNPGVFGSKICALCEDAALSRTGVCISCDAGMCRTSFHATCAQKCGLLQFPHEDGNLLAPGEQVDPYIGHCKVHSDKTKMTRKRRMYLAMQKLLKQRSFERLRRSEEARSSSVPLPPEYDPQRLFRKLTKHRTAYENAKSGKPQPWVPTEKVPRNFSTCPEAVMKMRHKADLMGLNAGVIEDTLIQQQSIADIRRKWNIPPAFTVEFVAYCLDRGKRIMELKSELVSLANRKTTLMEKADAAFKRYEEARARNEAAVRKRDEAVQEAEFLYKTVNDVICETRPLPKCLEPPLPPIRPFFASPVKAANDARKMNSVLPSHAQASASGSHKRPLQKKSSPNKNRKRGNGEFKVESLTCAECQSSREQHMIVTCDTCRSSYHLACCDPPLAKMPKKSKLYGWQCRKCVEEISSDSDGEKKVDTEAPRKLRGTVTRPKKFLDEVTTGMCNSAGDASSNGDSSRIGDGSSTDMETGPPVKRPRPLSGQGIQRKYVRKPSDSGSSGVLADNRSNSVSRDGLADVTRTESTAKHGLSSPRGPANQASAQNGDHKREMPSLVAISPSDLSGKQKLPIERAETQAGSATTSPGRSPPNKRRRPSASRKKSSPDMRTRCDVCSEPGSNANLVRCDECRRCFHFTCLEPPVTKSPKVRGYSWHCENCDPGSDNSDGPAFSAIKQPPKEKRRSRLREMMNRGLTPGQWLNEVGNGINEPQAAPARREGYNDAEANDVDFEAVDA